MVMYISPTRTWWELNATIDLDIFMIGLNTIVCDKKNQKKTHEIKAVFRDDIKLSSQIIPKYIRVLPIENNLRRTSQIIVIEQQFRTFYISFTWRNARYGPTSNLTLDVCFGGIS